jgi:hypothetical protein
MTEQKPTLKLKLSGESLLKVQAKLHSLPKFKPKDHDSLGKKKSKKKEQKPVSTKKQKILESSLTQQQFYSILESLRKTSPKAFPARNKPLVPLAIGIHKDIAKRFNIATRKAFYFCRMYCGTKSYKMACEKNGTPRVNLKGKRVGKTGE